jgi:hypothetical protein
MRPVAAAEHREAAFGDGVVVKPGNAVFQENLVFRFYDGFAVERSLAVLGSCYRKPCEFISPSAISLEKSELSICP